MSAVSLVTACSGAAGSAAAPAAGGLLFTLLPSSYTGVRFENRLTEPNALNVFTHRNFYHGGGVAIGDLTGDGLPEIVLTSNQGGTRLYLNEGKFRFRDVTDEAGLRNKDGSWTTGVTLADVNGDGRLDIYVCKAGKVQGALRANELWINQGLNAHGVPTFVEAAAACGSADTGYSTQAVFFDYDRDGDLDLLVINNSPRPVSSMPLENTRGLRDPLGGDRLYRNEGGHFVDVSAAAGIYGSEIGLGLGVVVSDVNRDGWPDIYVANDFFERDYLYINKGDGTFAERLEQEMPYISLSSMGLDIADVNNDGWPDIYVADMLPDDEHRLKTTTSFETWDRLQAELRNGFYYQFTRNMLHLNNGNGTFSDIGQMAGVARTDWSWSPLLADLDLDGYKDIYVTNGLAKDVTSQDYIAFLANRETMIQATSGGRVDFRRLVDAMSSTKLPNYAFRNRGDLTFSNESAAWGLDTPGFSSGAAYGDLDGEDRKSVVVNNVNDEAFVYRNNARTLTQNRFLQEAVLGERPGVVAVDERFVVDVVHHQIEGAVAIQVPVGRATREARRVQAPGGTLVREGQVAPVTERVVRQLGRAHRVDQPPEVHAAPARGLDHGLPVRQKRDVVLGRDVLRQAVGDVDVLVAVQIEIGEERAPAPVRPGHAGHLADVRERTVAVVEMEHVAGKLIIEAVTQLGLQDRKSVV